MQTPEHFRTLAEMLASLPLQNEPEIEPDDAPPQTPYDELLVRDIRIFHARIGEAVEAAVKFLLRDIAADVLARELQIAPADLTAIVKGALSRFTDETPLCVRVHPSDASVTIPGVPVVADQNMRSGDARIELRCGSIDASLGARLEDVLRTAL